MSPSKGFRFQLMFQKLNRNVLREWERLGALLGPVGLRPQICLTGCGRLGELRGVDKPELNREPLGRGSG